MLDPSPSGTTLRVRPWSNPALLAVVALSGAVVSCVAAFAVKGIVSYSYFVTNSSGPVIVATASSAGWCVMAILLLRNRAPIVAVWCSLGVAVCLVPEQWSAVAFDRWEFSLGRALVALPLVPLTYLLLTYPCYHLRPWHWATLAGAASAAVGLPGLAQWGPFEHFGWPAAVWIVVGFVPVGAAAISRLASSAGVTRQAVAPAAALLVITTAAVAVELLQEFAFPAFFPEVTSLPPVHDARDILVGLAPLAIAAGAFRRRAARGAVGRELVTATLESGTFDLQAVIQRCVADPTARVWLPSATPGLWLDPSGEAAALGPEAAEPGRRRVQATDRDGNPLALLDVRAGLADTDPDLLATTLQAVQVILEGSRLDAQLAHETAELDTSRSRVVLAVGEERRRVERELSAGPKSELALASAALARAAEPLLATEDAEESLACARGHVSSALAMLRTLAHGVHPPILSQAGLVAALRALGEDTSIPVSLSLVGIESHTRLRAAVESTAYLVASEGIALAQEEEAAGVQLRLELSADELTLDIDFTTTSDIGQDRLPTTEERLRSLGGGLRLGRSRDAGGPMVRAVLPATS